MSLFGDKTQEPVESMRHCRFGEEHPVSDFFEDGECNCLTENDDACAFWIDRLAEQSQIVMGAVLGDAKEAKPIPIAEAASRADQLLAEAFKRGAL
jgi:hypothetical protein